MDRFCYSCGSPLSMPDFRGPAEHYCRFCTDDRGELKSRESVQEGIAQWIMGWQPNMSFEKALARAELYMKAMPTWAD